jgi:hypothetical protein
MPTPTETPTPTPTPTATQVPVDALRFIADFRCAQVAVVGAGALTTPEVELRWAASGPPGTTVEIFRHIEGGSSERIYSGDNLEGTHVDRPPNGADIYYRLVVSAQGQSDSLQAPDKPYRTNCMPTLTPTPTPTLGLIIIPGPIIRLPTPTPAPIIIR